MYGKRNYSGTRASIFSGAIETEEIGEEENPKEEIYSTVGDSKALTISSSVLKRLGRKHAEFRDALRGLQRVLQIEEQEKCIESGYKIILIIRKFPAAHCIPTLRALPQAMLLTLVCSSLATNRYRGISSSRKCCIHEVQS